MKPFEIFRSGRHTYSKGVALAFSDADLVAVAGGYDTSLHHAPIVVDHKESGPAYGWVDGLEMKGDRLVAKPGEMDAAFSDLVREKKYRKISAAFYAPTSPNNPTPGTYYLRHVSFLGAAPPAVKGLKPVEFNDGDDAVVIEFAESDWRASWALDAMAGVLRRMREYFIAEKDVETADRMVPEYDIREISRAAEELRNEAKSDLRALPAYADTPGATATTSEDSEMDKNTGAAGASAAELDAREKAINDRVAEFAESQRQARATEDTAFVAGIAAAGRLPVGFEALAGALFAEFGDDADAVLTFSDAGEEKKMTPRAAFRSLLEGLPVPVETRELAAGEAGPDFSDPLEVANAITKEISDAAAKGQTLSPSAAAARLNLKRAA